MEYVGRTAIFEYPTLGYPIKYAGDYLLCRRSLCSLCACSPEPTTFHHDCIRLFFQRSRLNVPETFERLHTIGSFRSPWPRAELLRLRDKRPDSSATFREVVSKIGIPRLRDMPQEILEMIQHLTPNAQIWRFTRTIDAACSVVLTPRKKLKLGTIDLLERGKRPSIGLSSGETFVRIILDLDGIRLIERLDGRPKQCYNVSGDTAYIVEPEQALSEISVVLKVGVYLLRC